MKKDNILYVLFMAFLKFMANDFVGSSINFVMTVLIGIHTSSLIHDKKWIEKLIILVMITLIGNGLIIFIRYHLNNKNKLSSIINAAYNSQNELHANTTSQIYRINKEITKTIREDKFVTIDCYNKIYSFQSLGMDVCKSIYDLVTNEICDCDCQVTLFQRINKNQAKMIAYGNKENKEPSSFHNIFSLSKKVKEKTLFQQLFTNFESYPIILYNKRQIKKNFIKLNSSTIRESKIHQYIGIPIKTNRNEIEFILQIDSSKRKVLGHNKNYANKFYEILKPYANILSMHYERELVFTKLYEMLEKNLSREVTQIAN